MSRSKGFPLLAFFCGVATLGLVFDLPGKPLDSLAPGPIAARLGAIAFALLSGLVVAGLARGDRWVGRAMELWIAVWVLARLFEAHALHGWAVFAEGVTWAGVAFPASLMYIPVLYVKAELRRRTTPSPGRPPPGIVPLQRPAPPPAAAPAQQPAASWHTP